MSVFSLFDLINGAASFDPSYNGIWLGSEDESLATKGSARSIVKINDGVITFVKNNCKSNQSLKWRKEV